MPLWGYVAVLALVEVARRRADFAQSVPGAPFDFAERPELRAAQGWLLPRASRGQP